MQKQDSDNKSPFTKYREGYEDGYGGRIILMPEDKGYVAGYDAGSEDDQYGIPSKYSEE